MEYEKYLEFIKSNEKLALFDEVVGKYSLNYIYTKDMANNITESIFEELNLIIDKKLNELEIQFESQE